nr:MAG TPA: hypothetical protein [Bacteriophage sp.]
MGTKRISGPSISSLRMTGVVVPLGKARTIFPGCTVRSGSTKTVEPFGMETPPPDVDILSLSRTTAKVLAGISPTSCTQEVIEEFFIF